MNRREFVALPVAALAAGSLISAETDVPWQRKIRRIGQLNMTEHDPVELNVEDWADYWAGLKVDVVLVSVTGILAFYQTKVPFHRKGKYLGERDFFGECCSAAKKRGLRVVGRLSPDLNWADAVAAHPEWFQRDADGKPIALKEDPRLFRTCMFSSYMTDYVPAVMREVNSLYDVDALFTNAWPPLGQLPACHCAICSQLPASGTIAFWDKFNERTTFLWKLYDSIAKEKSAENFYFANLGGGIRSSANLVQLGQLSEWFQCDNQGRGGDDTPIWACSSQGRVCNAVQQGKMATNVTGAWSTGPVRWRYVAKAANEDRMWFNETVASGMVPYQHIIGAEKGLGEDRRVLETAREFFNWTAKHDVHFTNKKSIASIGVVMGQRTNLFYKPPAGVNVSHYMDGLYAALLDGRIFFDFVHEDKLSSNDLSKYSALILPNTALLSDRQCGQIADFAAAGGSLLATFETSMYDEQGRKRPDFGLADVFGIRKAGEIIGTNGNAYCARIERRHPIVADFENTAWIAGAEYRLPVSPVESSVLTVVPGSVAYPPELAYPSPSHTNEPAVVILEKGRSRRIYFPGDIERTAWRTGHTDLNTLLKNCIRWIAGENVPVQINGNGVVETFAWETQAGFAVHVLNYTNPAMHKGWIRESFPIGPQTVLLSLPQGRKVTRVELLRAEKTVAFGITNDKVSFTIAGVVDYEVAAIYAAKS
ncbi:MAG: alpha-amylase family protein [Bryobacteraceae bacterium]